MNRLGVLKDVAYGAKIGGGTVGGLNEAGLLQTGAMGIFNPSTGELLVAAGTNSTSVLADAKEVVLAFGRTDSPLLVTVPREVSNINRVNSREFVKPVITIGGTTTETSLPFENEGDVFVKVADTSFSSRFGLPSIRASVYKTASMSPENTVDAIVAKLNNDKNSFKVIATKIGTSPNFGITITPVENDVQIEVAQGEMWQGARNIQTTDPVYGIGAGKDILKLEEDFSVFEGNGNYIEYTKEFFKSTFDTDANARYDVITIATDAYHQGATTKRHVGLRNLLIGCLTGATVGADEVSTILGFVFPTYASETEGKEVGAGDGTNNDGVAGN